MNIPYDQIIAKANERKNTLQEYEDAMRDVAGRFDDSTMQDNFGALLRLKSAINKLDYEAKSLVGADELAAIKTWLDAVDLAWLRRLQRSMSEKNTANQAFNELVGREVIT